jgi:hypothetical protein
MIHYQYVDVLFGVIVDVRKVEESMSGEWHIGVSEHQLSSPCRAVIMILTSIPSSTNPLCNLARPAVHISRMRGGLSRLVSALAEDHPQ